MPNTRFIALATNYLDHWVKTNDRLVHFFDVPRTTAVLQIAHGLAHRHAHAAALMYHSLSDKSLLVGTVEAVLGAVGLKDSFFARAPGESFRDVFAVRRKTLFDRIAMALVVAAIMEDVSAVVDVVIDIGEWEVVKRDEIRAAVEVVFKAPQDDGGEVLYEDWLLTMLPFKVSIQDLDGSLQMIF